MHTFTPRSKHSTVDLKEASRSRGPALVGESESVIDGTAFGCFSGSIATAERNKSSSHVSDLFPRGISCRRLGEPDRSAVSLWAGKESSFGHEPPASPWNTFGLGKGGRAVRYADLSSSNISVSSVLVRFGEY